MIDFKLDTSEQEFQHQLLIEKGFKYYAEKCGILESENDELKHFEAECEMLQTYKAQADSLKGVVKKLKCESTLEIAKKRMTTKKRSGQESHIQELEAAMTNRNKQIAELKRDIQNNEEVVRLKHFVEKSKAYMTKDQFINCFKQ